MSLPDCTTPESDLHVDSLNETVRYAGPVSRPVLLAFPSVLPDGRRFYVLPPLPEGAVTNTSSMCSVLDWFDNSLKQEAELNAAHNIARAPDSFELLCRNLEQNECLPGNRNWKDLWGSEKGKTALVVSCGPSLTESLSEIKEKAADREHYFTLGINRALRAIDLDYYVVLDRRAQPDWVPRVPENTKLVAATTAAAHVTRAFPEERRFWGEPLLLPTQSQYEIMSVKMTITLCDALYVAARLGCSEVQLFGCDFAVEARHGQDDKKNSIYIVDRYYFDVQATRAMRIRADTYPSIFPVIGKNGVIVLINYELITQASFTWAMLDMMSHHGVLITDRTPRGILLWNNEGREHYDAR